MQIKTLANASDYPATLTYTVQPEFNGCKGDSFEIVITVNPTVGVDSLADQTLCNGDNTLAVNFTSSLDDNTNNIEEGTITYSWVNDNTNIGLAASGDGDISSFVATNGTTHGDIGLAASGIS